MVANEARFTCRMRAEPVTLEADTGGVSVWREISKQLPTYRTCREDKRGVKRPTQRLCLKSF